jgi:anti-sigma factor RsiW
VNCDKAAARVAACADGEVHGLERVWLEKHLRHCASCAALHADVLALRRQLRAEAPYYAVPAGLRERVQASLRETAHGTPPALRHDAPRARRGWLGATVAGVSGERFRWLGGGVLAGCAATLLVLTVGSAIVTYRTEHDVVAQAVAAHVRATLDDRLIAVVSTDEHTVKPWLSARLDYSPPVSDLAAEGFPLAGGRITDLDGRETATLVYRYRKHTIDVYVRPAAGTAIPMRSIRGFHVVPAAGNGWEWVIVSDAEPDALRRLAQTLVRDAGPN